MNSGRRSSVRHAFVDTVPDVEQMEDDVLYISMLFSTAIHKCACGCGHQTVTPFSPDEWSLTYNGQTVTLRPSIGNWGFECKSHYWVQANRIIWAKEGQRHLFSSLQCGMRNVAKRLLSILRRPQ